MQIQLDPERVQLGEEGDEVLEATAETIQPTRPSPRQIDGGWRHGGADRTPAAIAAHGTADAVVGVDLDDGGAMRLAARPG
jgi:hypothetical protein